MLLNVQFPPRSATGPRSESRTTTFPTPDVEHTSKPEFRVNAGLKSVFPFETVRKNVTIDWTIRENVRAQLRVLVKRILRRAT